MTIVPVGVVVLVILGLLAGVAVISREAKPGPAAERESVAEAQPVAREPAPPMPERTGRAP